ncbi:xanthine dehydrogenase family protein molybdopterin-binding subunit [Candidatus Hecatella orcuttiae]|jgi:putative selenate reductase molybdopterin-binding subunit|uniref:xanthine dehydrogenase family protein molybdopterin-binding subunit n=1 Tax=Candidatus Hecatella orcuttiae TaxID=1935119 RepID=UPI0028683AAD|nr:xanthine dehydrogenase family protein molybdopterin-binding subunit [Candidatus Hecatella orcuttiae]
MKEFRFIGKRVQRIDAVSKVTGACKYVEDLFVPGMLWGKILRSPYPHAKVLSVDASKAERLPGVKAILTPQEVIAKTKPSGPTTIKDEYVLKDKARHVGDEIVAVAAVSEDVAEEAVELIDVKYEVLPAVYDAEEAMKPGAPQIHDGVKNNTHHAKLRAGDVEKGFKESDRVFKERFVTSKQSPTPIEPHCALSHYDPVSGKLTHWSSTHTPHILRLDLAGTLGLPESKVRVTKPEGMGGGFGIKSDYPLDACAALLSMKTGKPVKMVLSREEEMLTRTRHPMIMEMEIGVGKDGKITALRNRAILDTGAYASFGLGVAYMAQAFTVGPYKIPNLWIDSYIVYTNKAPSGAFRGFGNPQVTFARESLLDIAAHEMGMDPVEFRRINLIKPEDLPYTTANGLIINSCGIEECLTKALEAVGREKLKPNQGIGVSCAMTWTGGKWLPGFDADYSSAIVQVNEDGTAMLFTGSCDLGTGLYTVLAQIVAEELGIPMENISVVAADTDATPPCLGAWGSRSATMAGSAVKLAAADAKKRMLEVAAEILETPSESLEVGGGKIFVKDDPDRAVTVGEVASTAYFSKKRGIVGPIIGRGVYDPPSVPFDENGCGNCCATYGFAAHAVLVEVSPETGHVKLVKYVTADDVGRALNPEIVEQQLQGGTAQGIGYGLFEGLVYNAESGHPFNPNFTDYKIPTAADLPDIQSLIVETIDPVTLLGQKGVGESGMVTSAPAIANAVYNAVKVRIKELPITPEKIMEALRKR